MGHGTTRFTLTEAKTRHGEVFDRAVAEPVTLTKNGRPSHVLMSAQHFASLIQRLEDLEDHAWGDRATAVRDTSPTVGPDAFEAMLKRMMDAAD